MRYSSVKNKRIKELKIDLICEISLANYDKYANIRPLETIFIDFALILNFQCALKYFPNFSHQKNPLIVLKPLIPFDIKVI